MYQVMHFPYSSGARTETSTWDPAMDEVVNKLHRKNQAPIGAEMKELKKWLNSGPRGIQHMLDNPYNMKGDALSSEDCPRLHYGIAVDQIIGLVQRYRTLDDIQDIILGCSKLFSWVAKAMPEKKETLAKQPIVDAVFSKLRSLLIMEYDIQGVYSLVRLITCMRDKNFITPYHVALMAWMLFSVRSSCVLLDSLVILLQMNRDNMHSKSSQALLRGMLEKVKEEMMMMKMIEGEGKHYNSTLQTGLFDALIDEIKCCVTGFLDYQERKRRQRKRKQ